MGEWSGGGVVWKNEWTGNETSMLCRVCEGHIGVWRLGVGSHPSMF